MRNFSLSIFEMSDYGCTLKFVEFGARSSSLDLFEVVVSVPLSANARYHSSKRRPACILEWTFDSKVYKIFLLKKGHAIIHGALSLVQCTLALQNFAEHLLQKPKNFRHPDKIQQNNPEGVFWEIRAFNWRYDVKFPDCPDFPMVKFRRLLYVFLKDRKKSFPPGRRTKTLVLQNWDRRTNWMKKGSMIFILSDFGRQGMILGIEKPENVIAFADRVHTALMKGVTEDKNVPDSEHHLRNLLDE